MTHLKITRSLVDMNFFVFFQYCLGLGLVLVLFGLFWIWLVVKGEDRSYLLGREE